MKWQVIQRQSEKQGATHQKAHRMTRGIFRPFGRGTLILQYGTRHRLQNITIFFLALAAATKFDQHTIISKTFPLNTILSGCGCGEVCSWTCVERATLVARDSPPTHFQKLSLPVSFSLFPHHYLLFSFPPYVGPFYTMVRFGTMDQGVLVPLLFDHMIQKLIQWGLCNVKVDSLLIFTTISKKEG